LPRGPGRKIVVDGVDYRWRVRRNGVRGCTDCDRLYLVVRKAASRSGHVVIAMPRPEGPDRAIAPRQIALLIRWCRARGWAPGERGAASFEVPSEVVSTLFPPCLPSPAGSF
jgi:hypothetical protein